ncbi:hypothetical protein ONS95_000945, partial [Cadophora gregata]|uniref:uncharacterized protein n=1 Tax=Cadophora gregata TaxID=51156 RepID=UPI0026DCB1C4
VKRIGDDGTKAISIYIPVQHQATKGYISIVKFELPHTFERSAAPRPVARMASLP